MGFNSDLGWFDLTADAANGANSMIGCLTSGERQYNEWQSFRAGRTNAQIATALSRSESDVAQLDACFAAMHALYNYANNGTPSQGDYLYSLRIFS